MQLTKRLQRYGDKPFTFPLGMRATQSRLAYSIGMNHFNQMGMTPLLADFVCEKTKVNGGVTAGELCNAVGWVLSDSLETGRWYPLAVYLLQYIGVDSLAQCARYEEQEVIRQQQIALKPSPAPHITEKFSSQTVQE